MKATIVRPGDAVLVTRPRPSAPTRRLRATTVRPSAYDEGTEYATVRYSEPVASDAAHRARRRLTFTDGTVATSPTTADWITG